MTEELLAAGAPVAAHWIADRQSGPLLLRFGSEAQRQRVPARDLPRRDLLLHRHERARFGSDLASIRTRAVAVEGGFEVTGAKVWTSNAHRAHYR